MAFRVRCEVRSAEFRRSREGVSKDGKTRLYCKFEDFDGNDFEVSVNDPNLVSSCRQLVKGQICDLDILCNATTDYSFISLLSEPMLLGD